MKIHNTLKIYNLPKQVKFCKECTISNQRPRISFDTKGVCSACNYSKIKRNKIDWKSRKNEFKKLLDRFRSKDGSYDVLVPCSGGKDGGYVAHALKYKYKMNPLTVTWSPLLYTEIGKKNLSAFINSGFDHILGTPNPLVVRKLTKLSFKELGDPFQPFIYGQVNFPLKTAINNNIKLIMYGENQEAEYGGDISKAFKPTRDVKDFDKYYFSGKNVEFWKSSGLSNKDLNCFKGPSISEIIKNKLEIHFFGYYNFWDPQENYYYCQENTGYNANTERTEGTYSKYASIDDKIDGFHYYLAYIKFGLGRATSDTAHEIRDQKINRNEGIKLVKKFDAEFPQKYFLEFLDFCGIDESFFFDVIDSWRSKHLWKKVKGNWELKYPIWQE